MKLLIDIPEHIYEHAKEGSEDSRDEGEAMRAIANGSPLPKGHGRLIDADALTKYIDDCDCFVGCEDESYGCADKCKCPDYLDEGMERIINNQPTIIEADKEVQG